MDSKIAADYAKAVFLIAKERGAEAKTGGELKAAQFAVNADSRFLNFLSCPAIPVAERVRVAEEVSGAGRLIREFIEMLVRKKIVPQLPDIIKEYEKLMEEAEGIERIEVTSAQALDVKQKKAAEEAVGKYLGKKIKAEYKTDENILAGISVRYGNKILDASMRSQLNAVKINLSKAADKATPKE